LRLLPFSLVPAKGFNIFQKLLVAFLLAIIPILVISTMINRSGEAATAREITTSLKSNASYYMSAFELEMRRVLRMKKQYILDNEVQRLSLFHMIYSDSDKVALIQSIERRLQQFREASLYVDKVKLYFPELDLTILNDRVEHALPEADITAIERQYTARKNIYPLGNSLIMSDKYPTDWMNESDARVLLEIVLSRKEMEASLRGLSGYNGGGAVLLDLDGDWILDSGANTAIPQQTLLELVQQEDRSQAASGIGRVRTDGETYRYAYEYSPLLNASLVLYVPEGSLLGPLRRYQQLYLVLAATSLLVMVFFSTWIYRLVHQPMYRLTGAFRRLEKGEFRTYLTPTRKDEFHYLYTQFNKMAERLQQLINDVYEQELRLNRAELKQLQAQINPHFLYNIFFLLNRIIQLEDTENAKKLTRYLGQFFRFVTRNKEDETELREELKHIESYIGIQQMRFGQQLRVEFPVLSEAAGRLQVPRLILQPIVENAFEYGLEDHPDGGLLRIRTEEADGELRIHIEDNGQGLTDRRLEELRQLLASGRDRETTGILNIHRRLQLKFGAGCGLEAERSGLGGLHVTMRLPGAHQEDSGGEEDVPLADRGQ